MHSATKRIQNSMSFIEGSSDKKILPSHFYIVILTIMNETIRLKKKYLFKMIKEADISIGYIYQNSMCLLFPNTTCTALKIDGDSYETTEPVDTVCRFSGSHNKICSFYVSQLAKKLCIDVDCRIVEFNNKTEVVVWFSNYILFNMNKTIIRLSDGIIKQPSNLTIDEIVSKLQKLGINWNDIPPSDKYGVFYKYIQEPNLPLCHQFTSMSENIDAQEFNKYISYFFKS